jgi:hypothetical protein
LETFPRGWKLSCWLSRIGEQGLIGPFDAHNLRAPWPALHAHEVGDDQARQVEGEEGVAVIDREVAGIVALMADVAPCVQERPRRPWWSRATAT